ncbi:MAG: sulfatase [Bacteroidetes bacterium]|nr:sulfatase [Bacteroidota bacterium]
MTKKNLLQKGILLGSAVLSMNVSAQNKMQRPNIIYIMCDDHGEQAISSYGHRLNKTPNIDRIANQGVRFTKAFVTNSICGPSRAVLLTGKFSHLNGFVDNDCTFNGEQQTFPKLLQGAGYETAIIGKWHLVSNPTGFNYWNILPGQGDYYNPDFINNGKKERKEGYVTNLITDYSLEWLDKQRDKNKPFCLMIHHKAPHRNWMPDIKNLNKFDSADIKVPDNFFDDYATRGRAAHEQEMEVARIMFPGYDLKLFDPLKSGFPSAATDSWLSRLNPTQLAAWVKAYSKKNQQFNDQHLTGKELALWKLKRYLQDYLATVESVDESVGKVLDYLDKTGLAKNTIVIYTSDQGFYLGEHGWFDKRFMYEESLKTPLLIRYPNHIEKGWVCDKMVQNLDFAETILDYAGVTIPKDMQGISMKPLLEKKVSKIRDDLYYHYYEYPGVHSAKRHYGIRTDRYKLIHFYYDNDEWELYDLKNDPKEMNNIYSNPSNKKIIETLKRRLVEMEKQYKVPSIEEEVKKIAPVK